MIGNYVCSNEGPCPFPRGDNNKKNENILTNFKNHLLKNQTWYKIIISRTKLSTKYPWVMGIQVCSNEGPCPFPRGDYSENLLTNSKNHLLKNQT